MRRVAIILTCALCLTACESEEEKLAKWQSFCTAHEFTEKQCQVLYVLKQGNEEAKVAANSAAITSGAAMGFAIGSMGARR